MPYFQRLREVKTSSFYQRLWTELEQIKVFDTHEHLTPPEEFTKSLEDTGVIFPHLFQGGYLYNFSIKPHAYDQWAQRIEEYRATGYLKSMMWALDELYGLEPPMNKAYFDKLEQILIPLYRDQPMDHMKDVIEKKMHAEGIMLNIDLDTHLGMHKHIPAIYAAAGIPSILEGISVPKSPYMGGNIVYTYADKYLKMDLKEIRTLQDYCNVTIKLLEYIKNSGNYLCFKIQSAYTRPISFPEPDENPNNIAQIFNKPLKSQTDLWLFGDYMMHFVLEWMYDHWNVPIQFHTGLARMYDEGSNAINLSYLFQKYALFHFDLFHGNYPYNNLGGMLHQIPNISADLCWLPIISPFAAQRTLTELIEVGDMVSGSQYHSPLSRTSAFGGDCRAVEGSYGALLMAKDVVIRSLEDLYNRGLILTEKDAIDIAEQVLYRNPKRIFTEYKK